MHVFWNDFSFSDSADSSFQGSSATAWKSQALPLVSLMTAFLLHAVCTKPCYGVDPFAPPVLGWVFPQLRIDQMDWSAFCGPRKDSQHLQEPCPALTGREGNPSVLLTYGFGWFVALIISSWQRTIQLSLLSTRNWLMEMEFSLSVLGERVSVCVRGS